MINEHTERELQSILGVKVLPDDFVSFFEKCKFHMDRISGRFNPGHHAIIVGLYKELQEKKLISNILDAIPKDLEEVEAVPAVIEKIKELPVEDDIFAEEPAWDSAEEGVLVHLKYRNKKRTGKFLCPLAGKDKGKLRIAIDGDDKAYREIKIENVTLA